MNHAVQPDPPPTNTQGASEFQRQLTNVDVFALVNTLVLLGMCVLRYYPRFVHYRGPGNLAEFLVYAAGLVGVVGLLWWYFRSHIFPTSLLVLIEMGIAMHFAGGLVSVSGQRLYDTHLFGMSEEWCRYDKLVHLVNALTVTMLIRRLYLTRAREDAVGRLFMALTTLGLGAVVEIGEYLVCRTIPGAGVGGYDNNLQDLIANLVGCSLGLVCAKLGDGADRAPTAVALCPPPDQAGS